jgi:hypothetical protein
MAREEALTVYFKRQIAGVSPVSPVTTEAPVDPMATSRWAQAQAGELEGMIKVILSRYLHVDSHIVFRPQVAEEPQSFFAMEVMENAVQPVVYRMQQTRRRMRSR